MGLANTVKSAAATAMAVIGDLAETVTYQRRAGTTYNATAGTSSDNAIEVQGVRIVLSSADKGRHDGVHPLPVPRGEVADRKGLLLQAALPFRPKPEDLILLPSGLKYLVIPPVTEDPVRATWSLQLKLLP